MQPWALLQFVFLLTTAISCFALTIGELHVIERAEKQEWTELKEKVAKMG